MAEARAVLRSLLRTVNTQLTSVSGNRLWHDEVVAEFRRHSTEADPARRAHNLQLARDYNFLLQSIREHKDLLLSYNIGVDRVASRQQQLQRSARSVGWDLPEEEEEDVQQEEQTQL